MHVQDSKTHYTQQLTACGFQSSSQAYQVNYMLAQRPITLVLMMINSSSYSTNDLVFI